MLKGVTEIQGECGTDSSITWVPLAKMLSSRYLNFFSCKMCLRCDTGSNEMSYATTGPLWTKKYTLLLFH